MLVSFFKPVDDSEIKYFTATIGNIPWLPVLRNAPHPLLPWKSQSVPFKLATEVRPYNDLWFTSSTKFILDGNVTSNHLKSIFDWNSPISARDLSQQLLAIAANYSQEKRNESTDQTFVSVIPQIYQKLSNFLNTPDFTDVTRICDRGPVVFTGNDFVPVQKVAFKSPIDMTPYLSVVPRDLITFESFFRALGVR